ncbi:DNA-directed RNA polymerase III subunit RPC4 [Temnothorax curvispinosus]|uniref:DNA-directed RNA polymerase III subunit RPC4 n=1 Tax=Temnothorax curvispinosus TaxID=300111 RepID=A0A6J1R1F6_9HYME|nr:DNA-directed RNA polymerase III subunit RPC4 [Temnothorax curvispinosus]
MASNGSNDALHANVRVKIEPGTSVSSEPSTSSLLERVTNIKMEPGLPTTTQRLTSYRLPRDLTLGGNIKTEKPKKVYTPNLNVQRNKKKDDPAISVKTEQARSRNSDRGRERGRGDRGRGRGDKANIIQSVGVWSEGIYTAPTAPRKFDGPRTSSSTGSATRRLVKPKLIKSKIIDKIEEEKKLQSLSGDDFIEDDPYTDADEKMCPLTLPRVKKDIYDGTDNDKTDNKPTISENGEAVNIEKRKESEQDKKEEITISKKIISQIIENKANSYTLIQFPESLPGLESNREEAGSKPNTSTRSDSKAKTERCTLKGLRDGLLGKLEILKSGKTRLRIGEMCFFVDIGAQQRFQQDLLAVKIDAASQTGDLINLGPVNNKLICSPDLESVLENS